MRTRFLIALILLLSPQVALAQTRDTLVVQTLTYDSLGPAVVYHFPDTGTYEKVLMEYSMRCHHALVSNGSNTEQGCGQWDYNCETFLTDSSRTDSVKSTAPNYTISNWPGENFPYTRT